MTADNPGGHVDSETGGDWPGSPDPMHPSPAELAACAGGALGRLRAGQIRLHLATCARCLSLFEWMDTSGGPGPEGGARPRPEHARPLKPAGIAVGGQGSSEVAEAELSSLLGSMLVDWLGDPARDLVILPVRGHEGALFSVESQCGGLCAVWFAPPHAAMLRLPFSGPTGFDVVARARIVPARTATSARHSNAASPAGAILDGVARRAAALPDDGAFVIGSSAFEGDGHHAAAALSLALWRGESPQPAEEPRPRRDPLPAAQVLCVAFQSLRGLRAPAGPGDDPAVVGWAAESDTAPMLTAGEFWSAGGILVAATREKRNLIVTVERDNTGLAGAEVALWRDGPARVSVVCATGLTDAAGTAALGLAAPWREPCVGERYRLVVALPGKSTDAAN